eukprot:7389608-Prymnesium_polylepis.1
MAAVAAQRGQLERDALFALEVALLLVQVQAGVAPPPAVWLLTAGTQHSRSPQRCAHAGAWGLGRSARAEVQLPVRCIDGAVGAALDRGGALTEPELVLRSSARHMPRLASVPRIAEPASPTTCANEAHV